MRTLIPWRAASLLAPAGALDLASVPRTPPGGRVRVTFAPTFPAGVLGRRWRCVALAVEEADGASVCGGLRVLPIRPALFAHRDDARVDGFTGRGPARKTSQEPNRGRKAHACGQAGDSAQHHRAQSLTCPSDTGIDRGEAASTLPSQGRPPRTDCTIHGLDRSGNKTAFVRVAFFSPYGRIKLFLKRHEKELQTKTSSRSHGSWQGLRCLSQGRLSFLRTTVHAVLTCRAHLVLHVWARGGTLFL